MEEREAPLSGDEEEQEPPKYIKNNVILELTSSLLQNDQLIRLVLQDI